MGLCGGLAINSRSTQPYRVATLTAVRNRPADSPPALPWKLCGDHMVAFHAGHELSQRMNACVYISASLSRGPGGGGGEPSWSHDHTQDVRRSSAVPATVRYPSKFFCQLTPNASFYGDSILRRWGWYEEGFVVGLCECSSSAGPVFPTFLTV